MKTYLPAFIKTNILGLGLFAGVLVVTLNSCYVTTGVAYQQSYAPPAWAPSYDDASVQYYYFPDYGMYYDVSGGLFWYSDNNGGWLSSSTAPYSDLNLYNANIVLINKQYSRPWASRHDYYTRNYPAHGYDNYQNVQVNNRVVRNTNPDHPFVPRNNGNGQNNQGQNNQQQDQQNDHNGGNRDHTQQQPTQPAQPTQPTQPTQPADGGRQHNRQPEQPAQPTQTQPTQPTQPADGGQQHNRQPQQPTQQQPTQQQPTPTQPVQPTQPANGGQQHNRQPVQPMQTQPTRAQQPRPMQTQPTRVQQPNNKSQPQKHQPAS